MSFQRFLKIIKIEISEIFENHQNWDFKDFLFQVLKIVKIEFLEIFFSIFKSRQNWFFFLLLILTFFFLFSFRIDDCKSISHFGCWFSCLSTQKVTLAKTDLLRNHNGQSWAFWWQSWLFSKSAQRRLPRHSVWKSLKKSRIQHCERSEQLSHFAWLSFFRF